MLKKVKITRRKKVGGRFAMVASRYNARYVDSMVKAARHTLAAAGAECIRIIRVPGAFEIPVIAGRLARETQSPWSAILCMGVILRGETTHAQHIGESVSHALARIQEASGIPIIHEVLLLESEEQAQERCLGQNHNRGAEAAQTALEMMEVVRKEFGGSNT